MTTSSAVAEEEERKELERLSAEERVSWAVQCFGEGLVMSTSFGVQSAVLLHLATRIKPEMAVIFVDTGYHFSETYRFAEELTERLSLNLKVYQPRLTAARQEALYGKRWENGKEGLEAYNRENKVEPMNRALRELGATAWISGVRRVQAFSRQGVEVLTLQNRTYKLYPIVDWTDYDIHRYLTAHDLPYHPLWEEGYVSVGDWHSTRRLAEGMKAEETRFNGLKRECGLHEASGQMDWQI